MQEMTADKYRELFKFRAEGKLPLMECVKSLLERLKKVYKPGMTVLDVGCGAGHYYQVLRELGDVKYVGVDVDPKMIEIANDVWKNTDAKFYVSNINNMLLLRDNSFDVVICYNVLLHLSDYKDALKELIRVSKKHLFVRSLFGVHSLEVRVPIPAGYGSVYDKLYYNKYSKNEVKEFIHSLDVRVGRLTFEDDMVVVPEGSDVALSKELGVKHDEFTSGDDEWKRMKLKYQVMHLEKLPKILAIIPARKGSKRLPNKNVLMFGKKPLWKHTYDAAMESAYVSEVVVSTNDERIINMLPVEHVIERPDYLCTDFASTYDVVIHCLDYKKQLGESYDYLIVLQPTSPLRTADDIDSMISFALAGDMSSVVSIVEFDKPIFGHVGEKLSVINGAMYFISTYKFDLQNAILNSDTKTYQMPVERSVDIDTLFDFEYAEWLYKRERMKKCKDVKNA